MKGLKSSASPESNGLSNLSDKGIDHQNFPISPKDEERQKQESNKKRLASLKQKQQEFKVQQDKIKAALANVDRSLAPNKKIVFDTESEDEGEAVIDDQGNIPYNKDTEKISEKSKKPVLFSESSSSDSEDIDSDEERFKIKPEYEGTSGKKLMHLQSKVGKDERFKLDERFLDSDDEEETNDQKGKDSEEGEKLKSLQILQEVVGKPLQIMSKNSTKKKFFRDMSALRYDPSREDHEHFEIKPLKAEVKTPDTMERKKEKKKKDKLSTEEPEVEAEPIPEVSKDRYFEVSTTFTDVFGKKSDDKQPSGTGFSFSSIF
ncbi:hypothetical protein FSP39_005142 [Pinctada imbricata]|uniref:Uncharacterized protein n=1 Tax=Pinctada imbricata TaxID=66713 RepID=A0AA88YAQ2_PINIB|nr:hypothetical protein FSP39_005142 [Pinctada imbricata]